MLIMILKMSAVTLLYVAVTALLWGQIRERRLRMPARIAVGVIYGVCAILSTHFGVEYSHMLLNVRDMGPLSAGLFFDPFAGILAGLIGGIERYIAGTYWGISSYTRIACSVSTCLAGFVAAGMHFLILKRKKPSAMYAFFMGSVMEVFHMYVVFITHREDMSMAFYVVRTCAPPMIVFTGAGMALSSVVLRIRAGEWRNPFRQRRGEDISVSQRFQAWLFGVTSVILVVTQLVAFGIQTQIAQQRARETLATEAGDIIENYNYPGARGALSHFNVTGGGLFDIIRDSTGRITAGEHLGTWVSPEDQQRLFGHPDGKPFRADVFGTLALCRVDRLEGEMTLLTALPISEVYADRDAQAYESFLAANLLFSVIYVLITMLVQGVVVQKLEMVTASLDRITHGNLDEVVSVRNSSEFASLSDDINQTVTVLKGFIAAAEKRIEEELEFARTIQDSALPKNFSFPRDEFEIYAMMDPAREVGGDFYDFFFVDSDRIALVIADVSGKGIPAALFMMRSKTAIRGLAESGLAPAEILYRANNTLCEGNDAEMFVTVWVGILDLRTGAMECANAGHEYPVVMRTGGEYAYVRDKHGLALAAMEGMRYRNYELRLEPGDSLFVYTDGVPEAINTAEQQYGPDRLIEVLNRGREKPMLELLPEVREDITRFVGEEDQFDDITMLGLRFYGPGGRPEKEAAPPADGEAVSAADAGSLPAEA